MKHIELKKNAKKLFAKMKKVGVSARSSGRASMAKLIILALMATASSSALVASASPAFASSIIYLAASTKEKKVEAPVAKPTTFRTDVSFAEVVVGDPDVAIITPLTDRSFYIVGLREGSTGVVLYDDNRKLVGSIDLTIGPDTKKLNATLKDALKTSSIKAKTANGRVVLSGKAKNSKAADKARKIAKRFDENAIDALDVEGSTQVQLQVRFVEANRSRSKELGIRFGAKKTGGSGSASGGTGAVGSLANALVSGSTPFGQFVGNLISKGLEVDVLLQALEKKGVARRLAEPNLVALSGDTASFLAGGEYPIPVSRSSGSDGDVGITYKKFGVGLEFTPTVLDNGLINMKISPEVSAIDPATSVKANGVEIPGLIVRRAKTTVELRDGQSFVMAGLLQSSGNYDVRKFPWLGDLPILGALFRSTSYRKNQTDLVIIVTPRLVKPIAPGKEIATPLDSHAPPNEVDLFVKGKTEVSRAKLRKLAKAKRNGNKGKYQKPVGHILDF